VGQVMIAIGKTNKMSVLRKVEQGYYLDGGENGDILLPMRESVRPLRDSETVEVFIYHDSEDRLVATMRPPTVEVGYAALLSVVSVTSFGAFLDWGLARDVLCPLSEQVVPMKKGGEYLVYAYIDQKTGKVTVSSKLHKFVRRYDGDLQVGQPVGLVIADKTEIGYSVIINNSWWGLIYDNEIFQTVTKGDFRTGYVKKIRDDGKVDCALQKAGFDRISGIAGDILEELQKSGGFIALNDRSSPRDIYARFQVSKKAFKSAVGTLYKSRIVTIEDGGIKLVEEE
jgi:predicted RNA-binding protein (virulence factor B family)